MKQSHKKVLIFSIIIILILLGTLYFTNKSKIVDVKYGDKVDLSKFEYLDTSKSSFVNGAWYDSYDDQMVIELGKAYYKYCYVPENVWDKFSEASSFGSFYNSNIKGDYDCSETSEFRKKMDVRWEKCWPFGGAEWEDIEKILKSKGWKDLDGSLWSDPNGNYLPAEELEDSEEVLEAFYEAFDNCMYTENNDNSEDFGFVFDHIVPLGIGGSDFKATSGEHTIKELQKLPSYNSSYVECFNNAIEEESKILTRAGYERQKDGTWINKEREYPRWYPEGELETEIEFRVSELFANCID